MRRRDRDICKVQVIAQQNSVATNVVMGLVTRPVATTEKLTRRRRRWDNPRFIVQ